MPERETAPAPNTELEVIPMTETMKSIPAINAVEGFSPAAYARELENGDGTKSLYLDVKYRLLWFRLRNPDGKIDTEIVHVDDKSAVVCCKLYHDKTDPVDQYLAKSTAQRFVSQEKFGDRYLEIAETAAMGRVLAAAGYGTQFCGSTDMLSDIIADAPVDMAIPSDEDELGVTASRVVHETKAQEEPAGQTQTAQMTAQTATTPQPPQPTMPSAAKPSAKKPRTLEDYLNSMTIEDAKSVVVEFGRNAGTSLGEIAMHKPADLDWYVKNYSGRNLALKAGAILLVESATKKAS